MQLARAARRGIEPLLSGIPKSWPYDDRVLAWLVPPLRDDVASYRKGSGPNMETLFQPSPLKHIDEGLYRELRVRLLRSLRRSSH
jgi:hypothetical protein